MADKFIIEDFESPNKEEIDLYLDIAFCLDLTEGNDEIIGIMKKFCSFIKNNIYEYCYCFCTSLKRLRIKIISFGGINSSVYSFPSDSGFFEAPGELAFLEDFLDEIEVKYNRCGKRNTLEALTTALKSDWSVSVDEYDRLRHCIVILTDGKIQTVENTYNSKFDCFANKQNPYENPLDFFEKKQQDFLAKSVRHSVRLFVFSPDDEFWDDFSDCLVTFTNQDGHLADLTFDKFIKAVIYGMTR